MAFVTRCQSSGSVGVSRSEEHTSELQPRLHLVCRLLLDKKREAPCHVIARLAVKPHPVAILRAMMRKPSCLISCSHSSPDEGVSALVGRQAAKKCAGSEC